MAENTSHEKEWQQSTTSGLRGHIKNKLHAAFPRTVSQVVKDDEMLKLVTKMEDNIFKKANSRSEYYQLIAEKIYKIQKRLAEVPDTHSGQQEVNNEEIHNMLSTLTLLDDASPPTEPQADAKLTLEERLAIVLHARQCQTDNCTTPNCLIMKLVLEHIKTCDLLEKCPNPHCNSSRLILKHYMGCRSIECPVCTPAREALGME